MVKMQNNWLQYNLLRVSRVHFGFVLAYAASIVAFDSWNLIPPEGLAQRWTLAALLLIITTACWYLAQVRIKHVSYYQALAWLLIIADVMVAGFTVYAERGMASRAVALFAIPIVIAATLMSRSALFATAFLSTAVYSLAAVRYFAAFPSEGYKVELYGVIAFYSACFFILAAFLNIIRRQSSKPSS